tara:strand:+ start:919 stop:2433 length:1515 start_codon:yes stop_codon:yes gene_type:complete
VFCLLGSEVAWSAGTVWRDRSLGKKTLMELNACNWLWNTGPEWGTRLMEDWVASQRLPEGPGWHPYMTSQRIVNWIKWGLMAGGLSEVLRGSLAQQLRFLEPRLAFDECDHKLINNAKALLFAGLCLADPRASHWRARGLRLLARYLPRLVLSDGGYAGRSPMYHNALLLDLLDVVNLLRAFREPLPDQLEARVTAALRWSRALCHADSVPALFNDAALDVVPATSRLVAYGRRLGLPEEGSGGEIGSCWLPASGVGRLCAGQALLLADVGPPGPDQAASHGHAGTLGFEFSLGQQRILVDTGLSTYEDLRYRAYERSTAAHNTLVVDGKNSSDVWGLFKLGRRARIVDTGYEEQACGGRLYAAHNGYSRRRADLVHRREWSLGAGCLALEDQLEGAGEHVVCVYFHLHPSLNVDIESPRQARISLPDGVTLALTVDSRLALSVEESYCSARFDDRQPNKVLRAEARLTLPVSLHHELTGWVGPAPSQGSRERPWPTVDTPPQA